MLKVNKCYYLNRHFKSLSNFVIEIKSKNLSISLAFKNEIKQYEHGIYWLHVNLKNMGWFQRVLPLIHQKLKGLGKVKDL